MGWGKPGDARYRPAKGAGVGPASGIPASGIPAGGQIWASSVKPARAWTDDYRPTGAAISAGKMEQAEYRAKLRAKLDKALDAIDAALDAPNEATRLAAAKHVEDRLFGQAKQVIEEQADTRTPEQLLADIERKRREAGLA